METKFIEKFIEVQSVASVKKEKKQGITFSSRSLEQILECIKPKLKELCLYITFNNDVILAGNESFVKSTVTISDGVNILQASALAMIPRYLEGKNRLHGQQDPQVTGSCISYSNKYALQNLLLIDENVDIDQDVNISGQKKENPQLDKCLLLKNKLIKNVDLTIDERNWLFGACEKHKISKELKPIEIAEKLIEIYKGV